MTEASSSPSSPSPQSQRVTPSSPATFTSRPLRKRKWFSLFLAFPVLVSWLYMAVLRSNPVRTLRSLRRVQQHPAVNTYVMDYYGDYKIDQLRRHGLRDIHQLEDSFIEIWFPAPIAWMASNLKRMFIPRNMHRSDDKDSDEHHCSTVTLNSGEAVYFGRNFDWDHDATLILRVHDGKRNNEGNSEGNDIDNDDDDLASIAVIDLHYLNLNRPHVEETNLWQRIPLLFAPYYVMDGMNRHGVAISDMTVPEPAHPPQHNSSEPSSNTHHTKKPDIIHSTLARIILDYATTTAEAVELMHDFQIHFPYADIHFMVADATGDSRIVEFLQGNIRVSSTDLPWHVSTNDIVWNKSEKEKDDNCYRYEKGSGLAEQLLLSYDDFASSTNGEKKSTRRRVDEKDAMHVTRSIAVDGWTMWTSIYELKGGEYWHFYKVQPDIVYRDTIRRKSL